MMEVRFHGRGGMGVKSSAAMLGLTAFFSGYQTQDFALYGAERRGAPLASFVRYDKKPIREKGYLLEPDAIIIMDETLDLDSATKGLKKAGFVIINNTKPAGYFKKKYGLKQIHCIDATSIALKNLGKPIINTAMLGSLVKLLKLPMFHPEEAIRKSLKDAGHPEFIDKNLAAVRESYKVIE
jgi:pyruvate ferredoxin oxidoreductase gamma subunit